MNLMGDKGFFKRIKSALLGNETETPKQESVSFSKAVEMDVRFAENYTQSGGYFVFCESNLELLENLKLLMMENNWTSLFSDDPHLDRLLRHAHIPFKNLLGLSECQARITPCEALIADLGQIMMSARTDKGRQLAACPKAHIVVAYTSQMAFSQEQAIANINKMSSIKPAVSYTLLGGPNALAIDKEVNNLGGCTPSELYLFLVED